MSLEKYQFWGIVIIVVVAMICITAEVIGILGHWTIRFEMDANTLEAIKSINWSAIANAGSNSPEETKGLLCQTNASVLYSPLDIN